MIFIGPGPGSGLGGAGLVASPAAELLRLVQVGATSLTPPRLPAEGPFELDSEIERSTDGADCGEGVSSTDVEW